MGSVLLVDATSIFAFQQSLRENEFPVEGNPDYGALLEALLKVRDADEAMPARSGVRYPEQALSIRFDQMIAFVAVDPEHEGQQRFCRFLRDKGFIVDETDFRDAFVVPKRLSKDSQYQRLSTRIAYVAGIMASPFDAKGARRVPHLIVVSDAFDVHAPLLDYVTNRNGNATLAFFRNGMEDRWQRAGLFNEDSPVRFHDLSDDAKRIIGADLSPSMRKRDGGKGLADLTL